RRAPDAVTVVSHDAFVQSRPVNRSVIAVTRDRLDQARVVGFAARVTPTRQSVLAQPTVVEARRPPERVTTREGIVRRQPAAAPCRSHRPDLARQHPTARPRPPHSPPPPPPPRAPPPPPQRAPPPRAETLHPAAPHPSRRAAAPDGPPARTGADVELDLRDCK